MRTRFAPEALAAPETAACEAEIRRCVHCGFCLPACPTYALLSDERDSPRGRIRLIQEMLERGGAPRAEEVLHVDRCLSCLACESACPSGVRFSTLIDEAREHIEQSYRRRWADRWVRALTAAVLPHPRRLRWALAIARLARPFAPLLGARLGVMLALAPRRVMGRAERPPLRDSGPRAILMAGCVEAVLRPQIRAAALRLLARQGLPAGCTAGEGCCGALSLHLGRRDEALAFARRNVAAWSAAVERGGVEAIVATASGCGTMIKDYGRLFAADPEWAPQARAVSALARDIGEVAAERGPIGRAPEPLLVGYLAPCSLQHGQRAAGAMKQALEQAGFAVVEPAEAAMCCGSAGSYSLLQPQLAGALRARKADTLAATGADVVAAGNIGCLMQIGDSAGRPALHPAELLDWAAGGPRPNALNPAPPAPPSSRAGRQGSSPPGAAPL